MSQALDDFNKSRWKTLGRKLGLKSGLLQKINSDYRRDGVEECFHQVLEEWLKRNHDVDRFGPPTWYSLANAVKRSGDAALADDIHAMH